MDLEKVGRIFLCQPCYGTGGFPQSYRSFWYGPILPDSPLRGKISLTPGGGSLLACSFNTLWAQALAAQANGEPYTHFGMLHNDIEPMDGWLDVLMEDLLATGADVMSAVIAIKDPLGLTSTAIDDPNDKFNVERRLTLKEVFRLPDVFSAADCGYPDRKLLVNTGCWVCDFTKPWRLAKNPDETLKVCFTIDDRIVVKKPFLEIVGTNGDGHKEDLGPKFALDVNVAPEDWNFSRSVQELGGKVMATQRVKAQHWGNLAFNNWQDWGNWEHDRSFANKFRNKEIPNHRPQKDDKVMDDLGIEEMRAFDRDVAIAVMNEP